MPALKPAHQVKVLTGYKPNTLTEAIIYSPTPIVLKDYCADWPLVRLAKDNLHSSADYLLSHYSGDPVHATFNAPEHKGRIFYNDTLDGFNFTASQVPLTKVIEQLFNHLDDSQPPGIYVASTDVRKWFPTLVDENASPIPNVQPIISLWLGNRSTIAAHYDFPTNLACNLVGNRRFTLFPPEQIANLYPGPIGFAPGGQQISMVDFADPDLTLYPQFPVAMQHGYEAELAPGDALIIPSMWWHHVQAKSAFNLLLTHWWRDTPAYLGRPDNALLSAILSLRSLPDAQRQAWKHIFEHYIFQSELPPLSQLNAQQKGILTHPLDERSARQLRTELLNQLRR